MVILIQPIALPTLLVFIALLVFILVYLTIFFKRRMKIFDLRNTPAVVIFGLPNSGKTTLAKSLAETNFISSPLLSNISYGSSLDGKTSIYDVDLFKKDGRIDERTARDLIALKPKMGLAVVDASEFSPTVEKQLELLSQAIKLVGLKNICWVVKKIDARRKEKLKVLRERVGKFYVVKKSNLRGFKKQLWKELETITSKI